MEGKECGSRGRAILADSSSRLTAMRSTSIPHSDDTITFYATENSLGFAKVSDVKILQ